MTKLPLFALALLAFAGLAAAAPAHAAGAPAPAAPAALCFANASSSASSTSPAPALGVPAPQPKVLNFLCGVCSDFLCRNKKAGDACGSGPFYQGFRCNNATRCADDGLYTCTCELA